MRTTYLTFSRFVVAIAAVGLAWLAVAQRTGAQLIDPYVNFFGMVLTHPTSVETNMAWNAVTYAGRGEWIAAPVGLSDLSNISDPTNPNRYIVETGASNDCRGFSDCLAHPYISFVDGDPSTTYFFVDTAYVIGSVQYKYQVLNTGIRQHAAIFCYGNPISCVQIGNTVTSAGHNTYNWGALGYESPTSTKISTPILFQNARFQYGTGTWDIFCPSYTGSNGISGAVLMPCISNPNGGTFSIVPGVRIFTPVVIKQ